MFSKQKRNGIFLLPLIIADYKDYPLGITNVEKGYVN